MRICEAEIEFLPGGEALLPCVLAVDTVVPGLLTIRWSVPGLQR